MVSAGTAVTEPGIWITDAIYLHDDGDDDDFLMLDWKEM
jgi:hypothetical protein